MKTEALPKKESPSAPAVMVRIVGPEVVVVGDRVHRAGDVVPVPEPLAEKLVSEGRASRGVKVRVIKAGLIGHRYCAVGDVLEADMDAAAHLIHREQVVYAGGGLPPLFPVIKNAWKYFAQPEAPDPYAGEPRVRVKALRLVAIPGGSMEAGQTASVPESHAARLLANKAVALAAPGETLSERGKAFLERLVSPRVGAPSY